MQSDEIGRMLWALQDMLSHPLGAFVCVGLARRRRAGLTAPLLLGLLLGWGSIPVVWLLTREASAHTTEWEKTGDPGLTPSEPHEGEPATGWPGRYFALRQKLVLGSLLALVPLPGLACMLLAFCLPTMVLLFEGTSLELPLWTRVLIFITQFSRTTLGLALIWLLFALWPVCLALLLQCSHRLPLLGRVWRHCDRIWWASGLALPSEVRFRGSPQIVGAEIGRAALDETARIVQRLVWLTWLLTLALIAASWFLPLYHLIGNVR